MAESEPEDLVQRKIAQFYKETLKMQKMHNVGLMTAIKELKNEMESIASKHNEAMDTRIPTNSESHSWEAQKIIHHWQINPSSHRKDGICWEDSSTGASKSDHPSWSHKEYTLY